jgi:hypothetical protein
MAGVFCLVIMCVYVVFIRPHSMFISKVITVAVSALLAGLPFLVRLVHRMGRKYFFRVKSRMGDVGLLFFLACAAAWVLCGIVIPFSVVASDPGEFSFLVENPSPFAVLLPSVFLAFGLFVFWPAYMYLLSPVKIKCIFACIASSFVFVGILNAFVFSGNYGTLSKILAFVPGVNLWGSPLFWGANIAVCLAAVFAVVLLCGLGKVRFLSPLVIILLISGGAVGVWKTANIQKVYSAYREVVMKNKETAVPGGGLNAEVRPAITLSTEGKNVVILMLDRAIGSYLPLIFDEKPELKTAFQGFVYYPNTVSFADGTVLGTPPIFGGYDYTPENLHARKNELMVTKHNEALLVLPTLFKRQEYSVSVFDLPYVNYQGIPEISYFTSKGINADNLLGKYDRLYFEEINRDRGLETPIDAVLRRNFVMFSLFSAAPAVLRTAIYRGGSYWNATENDYQNLVAVIDSYAELYYLPQMTATSATGNTLAMMANNITHSPLLLQYPDYTIPAKITETGPDRFNGDLFGLQHYHVNAAAYMLLSTWFDTLRELGVYDNTRIIIVADHGQRNVTTPLIPADVQDFAAANNPLLLVKDFNAAGEIKTDMTFMTNADVPFLAANGIIPGMENPFTGRPLEFKKDNGVTILISASANPSDYSGPEAIKSSFRLARVKNNIFEKSNWSELTWNE